jgi:hypothetical protein
MKHYVQVTIEFTEEVEVEEDMPRERVEVLVEEAWQRELGYHDEVQNLRVSTTYVSGDSEPANASPVTDLHAMFGLKGSR